MCFHKIIQDTPNYEIPRQEESRMCYLKQIPYYCVQCVPTEFVINTLIDLHYSNK